MSTDLHFCNLCDQSVAQDKLDAGEAVRHGGRVVCPTCCDTLMLATSSRTEEPKQVSLVMPLVVGFIGWGLALFAWFSHDQYRRSAEDRMSTHMESTDGALTNHIIKFQESLTARDAADTRLEGQVAEVAQSLADLSQDSAAGDAALSEAMAPLGPLVDAHAQTAETLGALQVQVGVLEETLREVRTQLEFLRDEVALLSRRVERGGPPEPQDGEFPAEVQTRLESLGDDDPLNRSSALEKLGEYDDPRLAPYVEPLLNDTYEMNRFYAAYALGEMGSLESCEGLIKALDDDYSFVRKAAAEALQKVTGQDLPFDHKAEQGERDGQKKAWQDWWDANKERLLGSAPAADSDAGE